MHGKCPEEEGLQLTRCSLPECYSCLVEGTSSGFLPPCASHHHGNWFRVHSACFYSKYVPKPGMIRQSSSKDIKITDGCMRNSSGKARGTMLQKPGALTFTRQRMHFKILHFARCSKFPRESETCRQLFFPSCVYYQAQTAACVDFNPEAQNLVPSSADDLFEKFKWKRYSNSSVLFAVFTSIYRYRGRIYFELKGLSERNDRYFVRCLPRDERGTSAVILLHVKNCFHLIWITSVSHRIPLVTKLVSSLQKLVSRKHPAILRH